MSTGAWDRTKRAAEDQLARLPIKFKEGLSWAVAENLLLSACDDVVLSPTSTYGYHAAGFGSLIPHRVLHEPNRQVYRVFSSEPQSHFWKPLMREVDRWKLCRVEEDLPARSQQEECCPRWDSEFDTEGPNHARGPGLEQALKDHETKWKGRIEQKKAQEEAAKAELAAKNGVKA
jgi:hypothetical protein